jgi:spore germination protein
METPRFLSFMNLHRMVLSSLTGALLALLVTTGIATAAQQRRPRTKSAEPASSSLPLALRRARWHVLGARPLGMYYYSTGDQRGLVSIAQHAAQITLLAPQCFWLDHDGFVHGQVPPALMDAARRANLPLMPLVTNPGFDRPLARKLLRNPHAQEIAAMYLAYLARRDNYLGWQLDLENIDPADKALYTRFVERVAARLHRDGRLLSVAVTVRFSDSYPDRPPTREFHTSDWGAPFDYRRLGRAADLITLMTYDQYNSSTPPGPVAGYAWVKAALDYAVRRVPRGKLLLGIPFYGRNWTQTAKGPSSSSLAFQDLAPLLKRSDAVRHWDERWRTNRLQFSEGGQRRTAWFDDPRSLREKLRLMRAYRLSGFAAWRLGTEDPRFWTMVAEFHQTPPAAKARRATARSKRAASRQRR